MRTCVKYSVSRSCVNDSKLSIYVGKLHANMDYEGKNYFTSSKSWALTFLEDFMCIIIVKYVHNKVLYLYIVSWFSFPSSE